MNDRGFIEWAPRVPLYEIRALYISSAGGIYDEALIDNVGIALYLRCESIMEFTEAFEGRVKCRRCAEGGVTVIILRKTMLPREVLVCPVCGWRLQWRVYQAESEKSRRGQLMAGHARSAFTDYLAGYPQCREPSEKLLAIDRLIHEFHWFLKADAGSSVAGRTACVNLLEGTTTEIMELLDGLAYSENTNPALLGTRGWWSGQRAIARRRNDK